MFYDNGIEQSLEHLKAIYHSARAHRGPGCLHSKVPLSQEVFSDTRRGLIEEGYIGYVATSKRQESRCVIEGQPKQKEEFGGRYIHVSLRASGKGNRLAETQKLLPFGYSGIYGESLEGFGRAEEGKVPTYFEAIANLKDMLAYCHVWGRMSFDIGEEDDEAREVVEALDEEAITITPKDSQRVREKIMQSRENAL